MAPPPHPIWALFEVTVARVKGVKPHPDAGCKACSKVLKNAQPSSYILSHVLKCENVDERSKARWAQYDSQRRHQKAAKLLTPASSARKTVSSTPRVRKTLFDTPQSAVERKSSRKRARASPLKSLKQREEDNFLRVAMGFIASGIPFRVIDDPHFRAMFDYKLPSRRQISGRLLDTLFARELARIISLMCGVTEWALVTAGWSNVNGDGMINFVFANPKMPPVFWKSINSKAEVHSGRYIADTILSAIVELKTHIGAGVVTAVVTDDAANMKKAWKFVRKERGRIICTGCTAHGMNLLMKDVFKLEFFKDVLDKAQKLARFIKARRGLWSWFRETQKQLKKKGEKRRRLSLTVVTRWYTHEKCVANVVQNRDVIAAIFSDTSFFNSYKGSELDEATKIFTDEAFWKNASAVVNLIRPIIASLAAFERDDCSISLVYHQFEWLCSHECYTKHLEGCNEEQQLQVLYAIKERRKKICWEPLGIAHMLDQTKSMAGHDSKKTINEATELAIHLGLVTNEQELDFHQQMQEFILEKDRWKGKEREDNDRYNPLNWWSLPSKKYALIQEFARLLLSIPTSSASSERSWSIHGFIHTKLRNRLPPERVNKLVFVYTNITRKSEVNHIMYQLFPDACDDSDDSDSSAANSDDDTVDDRGHRLLIPALPSAAFPSTVATPPAAQAGSDAFATPSLPQRQRWTCRT